MASSNQVRQYLAYWFQLGKPVLLEGRAVLPQPVLAGTGYSSSFEACWQQIQSATDECHLEGTEQTIAQLLSSEWEISDCARCAMPVPMRSVGINDSACPCVDLPTWPNTDLPQPRSPVDSTLHLQQLQQRLRRPSP